MSTTDQLLFQKLYGGLKINFLCFIWQNYLRFGKHFLQTIKSRVNHTGDRDNATDNSTNLGEQVRKWHLDTLNFYKERR
jgi:hypothetical protein